MEILHNFKLTIFIKLPEVLMNVLHHVSKR